MSFLDEIQDAKKEFLQEEWDKLIIDSWKNNPNSILLFMINDFMRKYNLGAQEFFKLKRVPRYTYQQRVRITRFIAAYLPLLSTHLWNGNKNTEELLKICTKLSTMWDPSDAQKGRKEYNELKAAEKKYEKGMMEKKAVKEYHQNSNRSNWGAAKK